MDDGKSAETEVSDEIKNPMGETENILNELIEGIESTSATSMEVDNKMECDQDNEFEENNQNVTNVAGQTSADPCSMEVCEETEKNGNSESLPDPVETAQNTTDSSASETGKTMKETFVESNGNGGNHYLADEPLSDSQNCYCGKERNLNVVELQCGNCSKWFHESCITIPLGKCLPFMTNYSFSCKRCSNSGLETFSKRQPNFSQICATVLANLLHQSRSAGHSRSMFSKDKEVIPYIEENWEYLTAVQRRVKQTWHNTVNKVMLKDTDIFTCEEHYDGNSLFGLVNQDLLKIGPGYEFAPKGSQRVSFDSMSAQAITKGRSSKRKFFETQMSGPGRKVKSDLVMPKLPPNGYPLEHPFNKDGYRYILAEPDPHAPFRQEFDESQDWAGKPIPGWLYRKLTPLNVLLALHDKAPQLRILEDRLSVTGDKGYCMVRATHGVCAGTWYFEVNLDDMPEGAATRIGWSQALANLQGPLGYDKFSYSWRSRKGTKFHESKGVHYTDEGYGQGDTLGFLIHLPQETDSVPLPPIYKDKPLVKFKSYLYYEEKDEIQEELKRMKSLRESKIVCYKNGKNMGVAFENIGKGTYYPAVSLYKSCTISLNFGPTFKYPPDIPHKAIYDLAHQATIEQVVTDLLYFTENKGKLRLDNI